MQKVLVKVGSVIVKSTDTLLAIRAEPEKTSASALTEKLGNASALLGHVNIELSYLRRDAIKPNLNNEYSSLCGSQVPITGLLFGDELQSQLNNIKATNKIGHTTTAKPSYRNHSDGWKAKPRFFREEGPVLPATQQQFLQITGNREEIQPVKCTDIPTNKVNMLQYLEHKVYCLKAGGLKQYCNQWQALTSDPEILQTILGQPIEFTGTPYQRVVPREKTVIDLGHWTWTKLRTCA